MSENNFEEGGLIHNISDQESGDDKPEINTIINEKCKLFGNESDAVKILLSEHFRDFRKSFFRTLQNKANKSIFEEIEKERINILNSYRIYLDKDKNELITNELKELNDLLRTYYKDSDFNNAFFINYFNNIKDANKLKNKIIYNYPKDEIETLNDIERIVKISKVLKHYLNTKIDDRIQINFDSEDRYESNPYSELKYNYLIIDTDEFSKMNEEQLLNNLSDNIHSNKLRRPITSYIAYNYIPILCKGSCLREAQEFNDHFEKWFINHITQTSCEKCIKIKTNLNNIKSQIRSLYIKSCIFSHNINEIMFHPLVLFTMSSFDYFYKKQLRKPPNKNIEKIVRFNTVPKLFNKGKYELQIIYNPQSMKYIYNCLLEYSKKNGLYIDCCFKNEIKTQPCPIDFKPKNFDEHMKKCNYYHSHLEKRRLYKIIENDICKNAIENGGWIINNEEKVECNNGDYCNKFHTRNELFFDERYYRKLYPCKEKSYCEKGDLCPKKHAIDINIKEIFLPKENKDYLNELMNKIKDKDKKLKESLSFFKYIQCASCLSFLDGKENKNMIYFFRCYHKICLKCYKYFKTCPLCGFKDNIFDKEKNDEKDYIEIILNYELPKQKEKKILKEDEDFEEIINIKNPKFYDNDINLQNEGENFYNNRRGRRRNNNFYQNDFSYKRRNNYNEYDDNHGNGRGGYRGRRNGKGRIRGRDRGRKRFDENEKENVIEKNNSNVKMDNIENENIFDERESEEIRRGKGRIRGKTRKIMNDFRNSEEKEYYYEKKESDISNNIQNLSNFEEIKKNENDDYNYEADFSMRNDNNEKDKEKIRCKGGRNQLNQRFIDENELSPCENDEQSQSKEKEEGEIEKEYEEDEKEEPKEEEKENAVKLSHFESKVDETSD